MFIDKSLPRLRKISNSSRTSLMFAIAISRMQRRRIRRKRAVMMKRKNRRITISNLG